MSKAEKIDTLLESAILCFANEGYAGASLRKIAAHAAISLGTIHMYYGSKVDLYKAANRHIWIELCNERDLLIKSALKTAAGSRPRLCDMIYALALPIVRRALSSSERDRAELFLIRSLVSEQEHMEADPDAGRTLVSWVNAFAQACPSLSRKDLMWAYSFVLGVIWSWRSLDHRYDDLLCQDLERDVNDVLDDIVCFCCAGVQSIIDRRSITRASAA